MKTNVVAKITINIIYGFGLLCLIISIGCLAFGADIVPYPEAMIPSSLSYYGFFAMACGFIPFAITTHIVYRLNGIKDFPNYKIRRFFLFLPSAICGVCFLIFAGIVLYMMGSAWLRATGIL